MLTKGRMWWHKWSRWVLGTRRLALEVGAWHGGGVVQGDMPLLQLSPSVYNGKHAWIGHKRGGGSISPSTTPPPCHAPTSKASRLIPNTQPLHLCHHILPLVNKRLLNLNWKMAVYVKSLERKSHKNTHKGMNKCTFYYCVMCIMTLSAQMWLMNNRICTRVVKILLYTYLYVYFWPCMHIFDFRKTAVNPIQIFNFKLIFCDNKV